MSYSDNLATMIAKAKNNNTEYLIPVNIDRLLELGGDELSEMIVRTNLMIREHPDINEKNTKTLYNQLKSQVETADAILGHRVRERDQIEDVCEKLKSENKENSFRALRKKVLNNLGHQSYSKLKMIADIINDDPTASPFDDLDYI